MNGKYFLHVDLETTSFGIAYADKKDFFIIAYYRDPIIFNFIEMLDSEVKSKVLKAVAAATKNINMRFTFLIKITNIKGNVNVFYERIERDKLISLVKGLAKMPDGRMALEYIIEMMGDDDE